MYPAKQKLLTAIYIAIDFIIVVAVLSLGLWACLLSVVFDVIQPHALWAWTVRAWAGDDLVWRVLLRLVFFLAVTSSTAFFLAVGRWTKSEAEVHRRGSDFGDRN
jgi:hypothetical protein